MINRSWCLMVSSGSLLVLFNTQMKWTNSSALEAVNSTQSNISALLSPIVRQEWKIWRKTWSWFGRELVRMKALWLETVLSGNDTTLSDVFVWMPLFSNAFNKSSAVWRAQKPLFFWFSAIWIFPTIFTSIKRFEASAGIYMFCCCIEVKLISWVQKESL